MVRQSAINHRRSIRLKEYDYTSPGAYYVTIVTKNRANIFGVVTAGKMRLNAYGQIAADCWSAIPMHFPNVELDEFNIMPNHIHGIIVICDRSPHSNPVGATHRVAHSPHTDISQPPDLDDVGATHRVAHPPHTNISQPPDLDDVGATHRVAHSPHTDISQPPDLDDVGATRWVAPTDPRIVRFGRVATELLEPVPSDSEGNTSPQSG